MIPAHSPNGGRSSLVVASHAFLQRTPMVSLGVGHPFPPVAGSKIEACYPCATPDEFRVAERRLNY
jgi:hypothetical protein